MTKCWSLDVDRKELVKGVVKEMGKGMEEMIGDSICVYG